MNTQRRMIPVDGQLHGEDGQSDTRRLAAQADPKERDRDERNELDRDEIRIDEDMSRTDPERASMPLEVSNADIESETPVPAPVPPAREAFSLAKLETPHLADQASSQAGERWQEIQAGFVDDPRKAVGDAHQLVGELVQRIVDGFAQERENLERQWSKGEDVSTEDLRICLKNYRAFFGRLLPTAHPDRSGGDRS